ncbi:MAG TPA: hypothetical protein VFW93_06335 [Aquabacterium sp.]|uniref:hypothetical protein n=1 Tax=Aquabacterium sp. TaxID=1872578 RepID=UPI002E37F913|nr:hypothetical protein [Aquabacterium sp.]HEX5355814.1 hypothetical protein [Aquabacterium sp.]
MSLKSTLGAAGLALSLAVLSGCASSPTSTNAAANTSGAVPKLKVVNNCSCQVPQEIPGLINAGYSIAAHNAGKAINQDDEATFAITQFSQRSAAGRLLAGAMAGKDEITGLVTYKGRTFTVNEYYLNIINTIDDAANKVGIYAFKGLAN